MDLIVYAYSHVFLYLRLPVIMANSTCSRSDILDESVKRGPKSHDVSVFGSGREEGECLDKLFVVDWLENAELDAREAIRTIPLCRDRSRTCEKTDLPKENISLHKPILQGSSHHIVLASPVSGNQPPSSPCLVSLSGRSLTLHQPVNTGISSQNEISYSVHSGNHPTSMARNSLSLGYLQRVR